MKSRTRAFTLIELLVVMSIIALLITIGLPRYFGSVDRAKEVTLAENLKVLRVTIDKFYADKGRYPNVLEELVQERYLREVPLDPITGSTATWATLSPADAQLGGIYDVKSGALGTAKDGRTYASF